MWLSIPEIFINFWKRILGVVAAEFADVKRLLQSGKLRRMEKYATMTAIVADVSGTLRKPGTAAKIAITLTSDRFTAAMGSKDNQMRVKKYFDALVRDNPIKSIIGATQEIYDSELKQAVDYKVRVYTYV